MTRNLEECARDNLSFEEVAPVAITLYADLEYEKEAKPTLRKVARVCRVTQQQAEDDIGWDGLYNEKFEEILEEYPVSTFIDQWGARCWRTPRERVCGDSSGFYPWYLTEKRLRQRIEESLED